MTEFRPCPNIPGYSVSECGIVRRDKPRADGSPWFLKVNSAGTVKANGHSYGVKRLVLEAWHPEILEARAAKLINPKTIIPDIPFRPCVGYPGYSISASGLVIRDKIGTRNARIITRTSHGDKYVLLNRREVLWATLLVQAWGDEAIPESSYPDGHVITLDEYREFKRASSTASSENA